jgi:hypothetical protein
MQINFFFNKAAVLRIRIRMFLGLPDPHPEPLSEVRIQLRILSSSKISKKNLDPTVL